MPNKSFDGDSKNQAFDGSGALAFVHYNSTSVQFQSAVVINFGSSVVDNRGNSMSSIESFDFSDLKDHIELNYNIATNPGVVSVGFPARDYLLSIFMNDGNDYLIIGDKLPDLANVAKKYGGAVVNGGDGNDTIWGGRLDDQINGGDDNDLIRGNGGKDILTGSTGNDKIYGGDGDDNITPDDFGGPATNDLIVGGKGHDTITLQDNRGVDKVQYLALSDSKAGARDSILYFEVGFDIIDLKQIDAIARTRGDDKFKIVNELTGKAGQLAWDVENAGTSFPQWIFEGDVNGDKKVDFELAVLAPKNTAGHDLADWFYL